MKAMGMLSAFVTMPRNWWSASMSLPVLCTLRGVKRMRRGLHPRGLRAKSRGILTRSRHDGHHESLATVPGRAPPLQAASGRIEVGLRDAELVARERLHLRWTDRHALLCHLLPHDGGLLRRPDHAAGLPL